MKSRHGLGVLAICGLVLGIMAISASGAQAGMWMVNGSNVSTALKVEAEVEVEYLEPVNKLEKHLVLLTKSGANAIEILCTEVTNVVGTITLEEITGTLNIKNCTTFINKKVEPNCKPTVEPIKAGGTVKAVLHEGKPYALLEGPGGVFATFNFNEETCIALTPAEKVTGMGWLEDCNNEFEKEKATHLVQEAKVPAEKLGGLFFGGNKATIDGSANVRLIDKEHAGMPFSGLAE